MFHEPKVFFFRIWGWVSFPLWTKNLIGIDFVWPSLTLMSSCPSCTPMRGSHAKCWDELTNDTFQMSKLGWTAVQSKQQTLKRTWTGSVCAVQSGGGTWTTHRRAFREDGTPLMSAERRDGDERKENTHINLVTTFGDFPLPAVCYVVWRRPPRTALPNLFFDPPDKVRRVNDSQDWREDFRVWS